MESTQSSYSIFQVIQSKEIDHRGLHRIFQKFVAYVAVLIEFMFSIYQISIISASPMLNNQPVQIELLNLTCQNQPSSRNFYDLLYPKWLRVAIFKNISSMKAQQPFCFKEWL